MAAPQGLIAAIDQIIAFFNSRRMDLPDGFFDRKAQFVINGAPFETLLGQPPDSPLILMLSRGPAGFRFTAKALQHALPDARIERGPSTPPIRHVETASPKAGGVSDMAFQLVLSGTLRDSGESVNTVIDVALRLTAADTVEIAEATMDESTLEKIRRARRS